MGRPRIGFRYFTLLRQQLTFKGAECGRKGSRLETVPRGQEKCELDEQSLYDLIFRRILHRRVMSPPW